MFYQFVPNMDGEMYQSTVLKCNPGDSIQMSSNFWWIASHRQHCSWVYHSLLMVTASGMSSFCMVPLLSAYVSSVILAVDCFSWRFIFHGDGGDFCPVGLRLVCALYKEHHVSLSVIMLCRNTGL